MRRLAFILFLAIAALSFERPLLDVVRRHAAMNAAFTREADRAPQLSAFLEQVRLRTRNGDSIALVAFPGQRDLYGYCYLRANYILAGRTVVSTMTRDYQFKPSALAEAKYVAAFGVQMGRGRVIWRGAGGELVLQP